MEDSTISVTEAPWTDQLAETSDVVIAPSTNNLEEIMPTLPISDFSELTSEIEENNSTNHQQNETQLMAFLEAFTAEDPMLDTYLPYSNQPEETNQMMDVLDSSLLDLAQSTLDPNETLVNQQENVNQIIQIAETASMIDPNLRQVNQQTWIAQIGDTGQYLLLNQLVPLNHTEATYSAELLNTNQVLVSNQPETIDSIMPITEPSLVGLSTQPTIEVNQAASQWGIVALVCPDQSTSDQSEMNNATVPATNNSEATWHVHPYVQASLDSLNDPQISGQEPTELTIISPGQITINEEVQPPSQDDSTIAIPIMTDPNGNPGLVTFRPGIYEGDAIPPVYADFSIIAASSDYEPPVLSPVFPELSINLEPSTEDQIVTEPVQTNFETTVCTDQGNSDNLLTTCLSIPENNFEETQPGVDYIISQKLLPSSFKPSITTNSGYIGVDAQLLTTLRHLKLILIYEGYHFSRYYCRGTKIRWQCVSRRCEAFLLSVGNRITMTHPVHNHFEIISQNSLFVPDTKTNTISLDYTASDTQSSLNDDDDANNAVDNMTLLYDRSSQRMSEDDYDLTKAMKSESENFPNIFGSKVKNFVFTSENAVSPHDPSLKIIAKYPPAPKETTKEDLASTTTTIYNVPDPLGICVTSYAPPVTPNELYIRNRRYYNAGILSKFNYMTVPEDTKVKVTISTKPRTSKPRVYYDGKLAPQRSNRGTPCSPLYTNVPITHDVATFTPIYMSNTPSTSVSTFPLCKQNIKTHARCGCVDTNARVNLSSTASQSTSTPSISIANIPINNTAVSTIIQTMSDAPSTNILPATHTPRTSYTLAGTTATAKRTLINIPYSPTHDPEYSQTQISEQHVFQGETSTNQYNMQLANTTSISFGTSSVSSHNRAVSTTTIMNPVQRPGHNSSIRTPNPHAIVPLPSLRRTMMPTGYSHRRLARARKSRNVQSNLRSYNK